MTLEQLRIFVGVATHAHVTRAAEALHLTQSAVSASVAALEERHQVRLFDRVGRRIELNETGAVFLEEARAILARVESAELLLADLGETTMGHVRVHASQTVASYWLPGVLMRFHARYPRVEIALTVANTSQVANALRSGEADLGLVEGRIAEGDLERRVVAKDHLVLVLPADHDLETTGHPEPQVLKELTWVLREVGSGTRSEFEAYCEKLGLAVRELDLVLEFPSNEAVLAAVGSSRCASVLSERAVAPSLALGTVRAIRLVDAARDFTALTHAKRQRTRATQALLDLMAENGERDAGRGAEPRS